ncbi:hypothetical protein SCHPADRAFT_912778 [Schizopora paradoxa]|uniref:RRM domain-containing protein n=1 Tax=Schizopora paradoxa TaxID=27342 RepID=A0A0H2SQ07_9AGAM|nr:hypothetical protein SCHPADRAFT_912778 [Schizopora paradoxa]
MARRLYLGRLPHDTRTEDISKLFDGFGRVTDVRVMTGFGFVEFESTRDAEDAVHQFNGKNFMGNNIVVEFAKEGRSRREPFEERPFARRIRPAGFRISVDNISRDTSWQDLKDFGREAGNVSFADIDRDVPGRGVLEYAVREDAENAVKVLDGKDLRGQAVTVALSEDRGGPDNFRRDDRHRDDRGRDDALYSRDDRYREDRHRDDRYSRDDKYRDSRRRGRSDSPPRRDERARSPRRDDDRRSGRDDGYERRRDDRRRDDRDAVRTDERPRASNGY